MERTRNNLNVVWVKFQIFVHSFGLDVIEVDWFKCCELDWLGAFVSIKINVLGNHLSPHRTLFGNLHEELKLFDWLAILSLSDQWRVSHVQCPLG